MRVRWTLWENQLCRCALDAEEEEYGPKMAQKGPNTAPKMAQDEPKTGTSPALYCEDTTYTRSSDGRGKLPQHCAMQR